MKRPFDMPGKTESMGMPSDDELRELWTRAVRLSRPWRGMLAHRLAYGIADDLEARGVTDADIDRVMGTLRCQERLKK